MTSPTARWRALRLVRRQDQASALGQLEATERELREIDGRLAVARHEESMLAEVALGPELGGVVGSAALEAAALARDAAADRRARLRERIDRLRGQRDAASTRVAQARRAVAEATRALELIDGRLGGGGPARSS
jgi:hypothetical protein